MVHPHQDLHTREYTSYIIMRSRQSSETKGAWGRVPVLARSLNPTTRSRETLTFWQLSFIHDVVGRTRNGSFSGVRRERVSTWCARTAPRSYRATQASRRTCNASKLSYEWRLPASTRYPKKTPGHKDVRGQSDGKKR